MSKRVQRNAAGREPYARIAGDRVFMEFTHTDTKETKRRWGTVHSDDIQFWDYTAVVFDDTPAMVLPILGYYLFDDDGTDPTGGTIEAHGRLGQ